VGDPNPIGVLAGSSRVLGWLTGWGTTLPPSWSVGPCGPVRGLMAQRLCAPFITYFDYVLLIV